MESFETLPFLRGISTAVSHPFVEPTRKDRRPRDLAFELHAAADDWFLKRFGVRFRSQAIFVTSLHVVASGYGPQTVRIVPLGNYRYCWSRSASDLLSILKGAAVGQVQGLLDAAQYVDMDLAAAHREGHEVMLYCDEYVAIPIESGPDPVSAPSAVDGKLIIV